MSSIYKVKVNANTDHEFEITPEEISKIDVITNSDMTSHILVNDKSYTTKIIASDLDTKKYEVKVNNTSYHVSIANELDIRIAAMGFSVGASKKIEAINAPMPGLLLDIQVEIGQEVKENDPLLILEAMKMENVILSPRNGIIKSIRAAQSEAVEKGQLLIEFE
ncbi:acetyl-CoA carboxylase biotin carboxyl carrier protein subunit [Aquimarina pacifica]|uniref:acetyl-CoA carboxylase biotin carboxyl carrier protein subunit n=1 Tax=Aquimarina pacifica TaxID=1296415 RepID=UPI00047199E7|nr:acetyl-CoA carboxylase biotin carboxyl carrier protein subunit [Aquimarina pacifica]